MLYTFSLEMARSFSNLLITSNQCYLPIGVLLVTAPVQRLDPSRLCLWMAFLKTLSSVLAGRLQRAVGLGSLAGDADG
jgi:hypothetical protein